MIRFRATVPKPLLWNRSKFENEIKGVAKRLNNRVDQTYDNITQTWENKPVFNKKIGASVLRGGLFGKGALYASVTTDSDIYWFVTKGTKPHPIEPKPTNPTGMLVFGSTYKAKTTPRVLKSSSGGSSGPSVFARRIEEHPGSEARNFEDEIVKEQKPLIEEDFSNVLKRQIKIELESYGI